MWQLVKNSFLKNDRTFSRKVVEMVLALALERTLSKRRIMSCYISKVKCTSTFSHLSLSGYFYCFCEGNIVVHDSACYGS